MRQIFVNLPVKDLNKSIEFFTKLGFTFNPQFTDENATCMIIAENIFAMLITHPRFKDFTDKEISDAHKTVEVINALSCSTREEVDTTVNAALAAGGTEPKPVQDHGWMYIRHIHDLDGHAWEFAFMDVSQIPKQ
jgi:predicted lactoylglutathione lyase